MKVWVQWASRGSRAAARVGHPPLMGALRLAQLGPRPGRPGLGRAQQVELALRLEPGEQLPRLDGVAEADRPLDRHGAHRPRLGARRGL
jgi:hypothetical protein